MFNKGVCWLVEGVRPGVELRHDVFDVNTFIARAENDPAPAQFVHTKRTAWNRETRPQPPLKKVSPQRASASVLLFKPTPLIFFLCPKFQEPQRASVGGAM